MNIKIDIDRLKEERKRIGLSQPDLAKRIGYTKQSISKWENSKEDVYIRGKILKKLASSLACTSDYLTGITNSRNTEVQGGEERKVLGISSSLQTEIREHIRIYTDEQLIFLNDLLKIIDVSEASHLLLFKKIFSSVLEISTMTFSHPLNNWNLFKNSFCNTSKTLENASTELRRYFPDKKMPEALEKSIKSYSEAIQKDFQRLSRPLQSEIFFEQSLKHIPDNFNSFLKTLDSELPDNDAKKLLITTYSEELTNALHTDIKKLLQVLQGPIV